MAAKFDLNDDGVVVIVGSGAGGGTLGNELAQKGIKVIGMTILPFEAIAVPLFYLHQKFPETFATSPEFLYGALLHARPAAAPTRLNIPFSPGCVVCVMRLGTTQREVDLVPVAVRHSL